MAQDIRKKLAATFSLLNWKYRFGLLALMFAGVLLVFGVSFWRHQSGEKLLILQIGQTMAAAGAHPTDDSVAVTRCVSSNLTLGCSTPAYCHGRDSGSRPGLKVRASCLQEHQTPGEQYETTFN